MLFRRRTPPSLAQRLRGLAWPRNGWGRSMRYFGKRILRLNATPHAVAAGVAAGTAMSFSPLLGLHTIAALALAFVMRGNLIAAALGTALGNPLFLPFLLGASYRVGVWIEGGHARSSAVHKVEAGLANVSWSALGDAVAALWPTLRPMLIGSVLLGAAVGVIAYFGVRAAVKAYQAGRLARLTARKTVSASGALTGIKVEEA
ncbi:MAG: DUF2062 domain-containing protein [Bauldia sp.]